MIESLSNLLEPTERESVLGDMQERGPDTRALFDVIGMVTLRQLQAFTSWRTLLLATLLILPTVAIANSAIAIADTLSYYPWLDLSPSSRPDFALMIFNSAIATLALSWTTGFGIGLSGRYRLLASLVPIVAIPIWLWNTPLLRRPTTSAAMLLLSYALIAAIPCALGLLRGWRGTPLGTKPAITMALLCLPFAFLLPNSPFWTKRLISIAAFWPAYYAVTLTRFARVR
jgi:hypothetical protein